MWQIPGELGKRPETVCFHWRKVNSSSMSLITDLGADLVVGLVGGATQLLRKRELQIIVTDVLLD